MPDESAPGSAPDDDAEGAHAPGRSVLLVEDDPLMQAKLTILLGAAGHAVDPVASLSAARQAIAVRNYPIVIIDRVVADGDGISICEQLRRQDGRGRAFVMVLSMLDSSVEVGRGLRAGADVYLSKQASDAEIVAYVDAAMSVYRFGQRRR